jgi:hypothetical protein
VQTTAQLLETLDPDRCRHWPTFALSQLQEACLAHHQFDRRPGWQVDFQIVPQFISVFRQPKHSIVFGYEYRRRSLEFSTNAQKPIDYFVLAPGPASHDSAHSSSVRWVPTLGANANTLDTDLV